MPTPGRHTIRKPKKKRIQVRALVYAADGPERPYPVYEFANGKRRIERPGHNPFAEAP